MREGVDRIAETCAVTTVMHQLVGTLSKGFRRRVGLAQTWNMVAAPSIILVIAITLFGPYEDSEGTITVDGVTYAETPQETLVIGVFFRFADYEAADTTIKEVGFFGGNVAYVEGVSGPVADNGIYHAVENPDGEVLVPGYLYEVRNIPDFSKGANTMLELVAVVKL